jgi:hypothetical protein
LTSVLKELGGILSEGAAKAEAYVLAQAKATSLAGELRQDQLAKYIERMEVKKLMAQLQSKNRR